jgi:ribonuclease P protein component
VEGAPRRVLGLMARRADFLAANRGQRAPMPGFVLLVNDRRDGDPMPRIGITVTKKIGGAVIRNRMKRRFRALVREILPEHAIAGADHVLIGREGGVERDYALLRAELEKALHRIASGKGAPPRQGGKPRRGSGGRSSPGAVKRPNPPADS